MRYKLVSRIAHQDRRKKYVNLALHTIVDLSDAQRHLFFAFVVLHQQPRDRCAQSGLTRLQRNPDLVRASSCLP
jgi:hypothetical protein